MRYFSMFTGIGGFELGIGSRGECIGFSEIDKYCSQLLQIKWPTVKNYGDATKINESELPDFDLLVGGFPCQSFSIAGDRKGFDDIRGTLFFDIARILAVKKPVYVLLENVKGLLSHEGGRTFQTILGVLTDLGYLIEWQVLNSKNFGVPQNRERVFVVGYLGRQPRSKIFPIGPIHTVSGPEDESNKGRSQAQYSTTLRRNPAKKADDTFIHVIGSLNDKKWQRFNESSRRVYGADGIAPTIPTVSGGGHLPKIADGIRIRKLTPIECERLQGFPDNWTAGFSDTQRYKMAGNAVTVNVVREIISRLV